MTSVSTATSENERLAAEALRMDLARQINAEPGSREALEAVYGKGNVYSTDEVREQFEVIGFSAPLVVVTRKSDGVKGSLMFQHHPRFYFQFESHRG